MVALKYEKRSGGSPRLATPLRDTASAQPFLSPAQRREHARQVDQIVKLAAEGRYPESLWPVAASVGFGPEDLKRLPVAVAAGVAEEQEKRAARRAPVGRNLAALIELCGVETLLREDSRDLLEILEKATIRAASLSLARNMRCNEAAAGEQLSHSSANVTAVEAQRSGNTAARLTASTLQLQHARQKLEIEAAKAERAGLLQPEARRDEFRRGRKIGERVETDRAREKYQKQRDEHELALALEAAAEEAAKRRMATAPSEAGEAGDGQDHGTTPCNASDDPRLSPRREEPNCDAGIPAREPTAGEAESATAERLAAEPHRRWDQHEMDGIADAGLAADCHATPYAVSGEVEAGASGSPPIEAEGGIVLVLETSIASAEAMEAEKGQDRHASPCTVSDTGKPREGETAAAGGAIEPPAPLLHGVRIAAPAAPGVAPIVAPSPPGQPARRGRRAMAAARAAALAAGRATARAAMPQATSVVTWAAEARSGQASPCTVSDDPRLCPQPGESDSSATAELLVPVAMLPLPLADRRAAASDALRALQSPAAQDDPANGWEVEMLGIAVKTGRASASIVARFAEETTASDIFPEPGSTAGKRPTFPEFLGRLAPRGWPRVTATGSSSMSLMT
jgi:hypothetical protein